MSQCSIKTSYFSRKLCVSVTIFFSTMCYCFTKCYMVLQSCHFLHIFSMVTTSRKSTILCTIRTSKKWQTVPVGHIWKFDLEEYEIRSFVMKFNFSKIRIEPVMLNFSRQLKTSEKKSEKPNCNCGKVADKTAGNYYSQFPRF